MSTATSVAIMNDVIGCFRCIFFFVFLLYVPSSTACIHARCLMLSDAIVSSVRPLCHVSNVSNVRSCAQLCASENSCAAARHNPFSMRCDLFTANFDSLEGAAAVAEVGGRVELWAIADRGFGICPASYTAKWRSSRYRISKDRRKWFAADRQCRKEGGKLAELTSMEEMYAVTKQLGTKDRTLAFVGGMQALGAKEPAGGWSWYRSRLPVAPEMWGGKGTTNFNNQRYLVVHMTKNSAYLGEVIDKHILFLCECHVL